MITTYLLDCSFAKSLMTDCIKFLMSCLINLNNSLTKIPAIFETTLMKNFLNFFIKSPNDVIKSIANLPRAFNIIANGNKTLGDNNENAKPFTIFRTKFKSISA